MGRWGSGGRAEGQLVQTNPTECCAGRGGCNCGGTGVSTQAYHSDPDIYGLFSHIPNAELCFSELAEGGLWKDCF